MNIIVQGNLIRTEDIWDIIYEYSSRKVSLTVRIIDKPDIVMSENIPYESSGSDVRHKCDPYERLYNSLKEQWDKNKTSIPIFKL